MDAGAGFPAIGFIVIDSHSVNFHLRTGAAQANIWLIVAFAAAVRGCRFVLLLGSRAEVFGGQASLPL